MLLQLSSYYTSVLLLLTYYHVVIAQGIVNFLIDWRRNFASRIASSPLIWFWPQVNLYLNAAHFNTVIEFLQLKMFRRKKYWLKVVFYFARNLDKMSCVLCTILRAFNSFFFGTKSRRFRSRRVKRLKAFTTNEWHNYSWTLLLINIFSVETILTVKIGWPY